MQEFKLHVLVLPENAAGISPALPAVGHLGYIPFAFSPLFGYHLRRGPFPPCKFSLGNQWHDVHKVSPPFSGVPGDEGYFDIIDAGDENGIDLYNQPGIDGIGQAPPLVVQN